MGKEFPKLILLFSGKRKSGKDTLTDMIFERFLATRNRLERVTRLGKVWFASCSYLKCPCNRYQKLLNDTFRVKDVAVNIKLSAPIKSHFAQSRGLDFNQLMGTGDYKEQYRLEMIKWSEQVRNTDYGYFCRAAIHMASASDKPVWIVTDMRRRTDLQWFRENYNNIVTVKVYSSEEERKKRGWIFTAGIDDQETECDLDSINEWDIIIENNGTLEDVQPDIDQIVQRIFQAVGS